MSKTNNAEVRLKEGESLERLIKRFRKKVSKSGCLQKYKEKMFFEKKSDKKRKYKKQKNYEFQKQEVKRKLREDK